MSKRIAISDEAEVLVRDVVDAAQAYGWSSDQGDSRDAELDGKLLTRRERALRKYISTLEARRGDIQGR